MPWSAQLILSPIFESMVDEVMKMSTGTRARHDSTKIRPVMEVRVGNSSESCLSLKYLTNPILKATMS